MVDFLICLGLVLEESGLFHVNVVVCVCRTRDLYLTLGTIRHLNFRTVQCNILAGYWWG